MKQLAICDRCGDPQILPQSPSINPRKTRPANNTSSAPVALHGFGGDWTVTSFSVFEVFDDAGVHGLGHHPEAYQT
jgi:hypothetical protein